MRISIVILRYKKKLMKIAGKMNSLLVRSVAGFESSNTLEEKLYEVIAYSSSPLDSKSMEFALLSLNFREEQVHSALKTIAVKFLRTQKFMGMLLVETSKEVLKSATRSEIDSLLRQLNGFVNEFLELYGYEECYSDSRFLAYYRLVQELEASSCTKIPAPLVDSFVNASKAQARWVLEDQDNLNEGVFIASGEECQPSLLWDESVISYIYAQRLDFFTEEQIKNNLKREGIVIEEVAEHFDIANDRFIAEASRRVQYFAVVGVLGVFIAVLLFWKHGSTLRTWFLASVGVGFLYSAILLHHRIKSRSD